MNRRESVRQEREPVAAFERLNGRYDREDCFDRAQSAARAVRSSSRKPRRAEEAVQPSSQHLRPASVGSTRARKLLSAGKYLTENFVVAPSFELGI